MMSSPFLRAASRSLPFVSVVFLALACAACGEAPPPAAAADPPTAIPRITDRVEAAGASDVAVAVRYPAMRNELAPLDRAMHAYADAQRAALATRIKETKDASERSEKPGRLDLDFVIAAQTEDFVSALAQGEADFGGAHPQPLRATFTQHLATGDIVTLRDLFNDVDAALATFSAEARRRLGADFEARVRAENLSDKLLAERLKAMHEMLEAGTAPQAENFAAFLVDGVDGKAIGITLIFAPGQVASYVEGAQQVAVPARVFFGQLKARYRDAFAVDKADLEAASKPPQL